MKILTLVLVLCGSMASATTHTEAVLARKAALEHKLRNNPRVVGVGIGIEGGLYVYALCPVKGIPSKFRGVPVYVQCTDSTKER